MRVSSQTLWIGAGALAALYLLRVAADKASGAVNPSSDSNLAYLGVNQVGDIINDGQDDDDFNLGYWLYDQTHTPTGDLKKPGIFGWWIPGI